MASPEETARSIIEAWISGFVWTTSPNIAVRAHTPLGATDGATEEGDCTPRLPTLDFEMPQSDELLWDIPLAREDSPTDQIVYDLGRMEAKATFIFKCSSQPQAETFRQEWRRNTFQSMLSDGNARMPVTKVLPGIFESLNDHVRVMLEPATFIFQPTSGDTVLENLWILRHDALISYPLLQVESGSTGRICDIVLEHSRCT